MRGGINEWIRKVKWVLGSWPAISFCDMAGQWIYPCVSGFGSWATSSSLKTCIPYFGVPQWDRIGSIIRCANSAHVAMVCWFITNINCHVKIIYFNQFCLIFTFRVHELIVQIMEIKCLKGSKYLMTVIYDRKLYTCLMLSTWSEKILILLFMVYDFKYWMK